MNTNEKTLRQTLGLKIAGQGHKNYSVKAGAGGGKTTMLSQRICMQILEGVPIDKFAIITYTNAAAAELKGKIARQLEKKLKEGISDPARRVIAEEALNSIELMQISTIHSFLYKILRECSFEAGISMDVRMLEQEEDDERKVTFFNRWYREHYDEISAYSPDWQIETSTPGVFIDHTREVFLRTFLDLANVCEQVVLDPSDHSALYTQEAGAYIDEWFSKLKIFRQVFLENLPKKKNGEPRAMLKDAQAIIAGIPETQSGDAISFACGLGSTISLIDKVRRNKNKTFYGSKYDDSMLRDIIPPLPKPDITWNFDKRYHTYYLPSEKAIRAAQYAIRMQQEYQKEIDAETKVLSNDDILYRSERLLSSHPEILDRIRGKYAKIYVDEFQDTTGLQTRIVRMITEKAGSPVTSEEDWSGLSQDKLLVVGDPKQSIYRFTGAEKDIYDETDRRLSALPDHLAESVVLDSNFRSNKKIVTWVNHVFGKLMPESYTLMDTDWEVKDSRALSGVFRLGEMAQEDYKKPDDVEAVADLVERLVGSDAYFLEEPVRGKNGEINGRNLRRITYSDIMIITRNTTNMKSYVKEFAERGIPVSLQGKFMINDDIVLRNFVLLVSFFAKTKNIRNRSIAVQIIRGFDITERSRDEVSAAVDELYGLSNEFREKDMGPEAILQYLLRHEKLFLPHDISFTAEGVRSYRIRLHQMVETCLTSEDAGDLLTIAELLQDYLQTQVKREVPLDSNENAVRFMNVHQAKGLTGQIVIIADRSVKEVYDSFGGYKKGGKYYPAASYKMIEDARPVCVPTYGYSLDNLLAEYRENKDEAIRLQYVAATRAAHALIFMPLVDNIGAVPWFTEPEYELDELPDLEEWMTEREDEAEESAGIGLSELQDGTKSAGSAEVSSGSDSRPDKITLHDLAENIEKTDFGSLSGKRLISIAPSSLEPSGVTGYDPKDGKYTKEDRPGGVTFGIVMHRVYELMVLQYGILDNLPEKERGEKIYQIIRQAILESRDDMLAGDSPEEFYSFLGQIMPGYFERVIRPVMTDADQAYPEYSFSFFLEDQEKKDFLDAFEPYLNKSAFGSKMEMQGSRIWINGHADLVLRRKDGSIKIYDYKSDARCGMPLGDFEQSLKDHYKGQMELYRYAISRAFGTDGVETELIHLYL